MTDTPLIDRSLTVKELARRWRCRPEFVREMIRSGRLPAIQINNRTRIVPEAIRAAETQTIAARPVKRRKQREVIPREVRELLDSD